MGSLYILYWMDMVNPNVSLVYLLETFTGVDLRLPRLFIFLEEWSEMVCSFYGGRPHAGLNGSSFTNPKVAVL